MEGAISDPPQKREWNSGMNSAVFWQKYVSACIG
jgi:hypothetical protein